MFRGLFPFESAVHLFRCRSVVPIGYIFVSNISPAGKRWSGLNRLHSRKLYVQKRIAVRYLSLWKHGKVIYKSETIDDRTSLLPVQWIRLRRRRESI